MSRPPKPVLIGEIFVDRVRSIFLDSRLNGYDRLTLQCWVNELEAGHRAYPARLRWMYAQLADLEEAQRRARPPANPAPQPAG